MIVGFSEITIEVPDLATAIDDYQCFLGADAGKFSPLRNVGIRLREAPLIEAAQITALGLFSDSDTDGMPDTRQRGLVLPVATQRSVLTGDEATAHGICAVDHIVLMTRDADDCIRLFGDEGLGMRLALDQLVPEWGGRMLFFRCGKMTLEVIHNLDDPPQQDAFWGITYLCENLDLTLQSLGRADVEHSEARQGRKPGTRVATITSHNLGLPTLLIEPAQA